MFGWSGSALATADPWSIVALPDTQRYSERAPRFFLAQTNWVVDNLENRNIVFLSHQGDIVHHGFDTDEWDRADQAMSILDGDLVANPNGLVPYSTVIGNHDYSTRQDRTSSTANYENYFGPSRYAGRDWFGGSSPNNLNTYQMFEGGGRTFLHLGLEWEAEGTATDPRTPMGWAQSILDQYPTTPTIITTHSYVWDKPGQEGRSTTNQSPGGNSGQAIFEQLVSPNPQVFMTLNGHWHLAPDGQDGEFHQVSTNDAGLAVYEMLADFQAYTGGGQGYQRLIDFLPGQGGGGSDRIKVSTYSPELDQSLVDANSDFFFDLDFEQRFFEAGPIMRNASFQQRVGDYIGTVDTYVLAADPTAANATATTLNADAQNPNGSGLPAHALLRFGDLVGQGSGQLRPGAQIVSAQLKLQTTNPTTDGAAFHRMLEGWSDQDTWDSLVAGITPDGTEAMVEADASLNQMLTGSTTLDVTASLQAWVEGGQANLGWAILPLGSNGWDFASAESAPSPTLLVSFLLPGDVNADGLIDELDIDAFVAALSARGDQNQFELLNPQWDWDAGDLNADGFVDILDVPGLITQLTVNGVGPESIESALSHVPEPATLAVLLLGLLGLLGLHRWPKPVAGLRSRQPTGFTGSCVVRGRHR